MPNATAGSVTAVLQLTEKGASVFRLRSTREITGLIAGLNQPLLDRQSAEKTIQ